MEVFDPSVSPQEPATPGEALAAGALGGGETPADAAASLRQRALELGWRQLNRRDRTVFELRRHLEGKDVPDATIDDVLGELAAEGYLDDARYAARFAEDKRLLESWGAERIERRLLAAGVSRDVVRATRAAHGAEDERAAAAALLARRFPGPLDDARAVQRVFGVLVRKGFDPDLAGDVIRAHRRGDG